ncbi:MAG TPA: ABC transporter ATP-binding protein [Micromonosporaceae bacterium]|nr:ABC transporter ATP-binding protein [Micromonosporaceae bacterium]
MTGHKVTLPGGDSGESIGRTLRRGLALSPELFRGLAVTLVLATVMTAGRAAVPVAIQLGIDKGIRAPGGADLRVVTTVVAVAAAILVLTSAAGYLMYRRLFTVSETALAVVRAKVFRHLHDVSMLHQQTERRGALVSRVTGDVDQITLFLQLSGVVLLISVGQATVATAVMAAYSWQLALVVLAVFGPSLLVIRALQQRLGGAFSEVRRRAAVMLGMVSESVVGAEVIRAYGVAGRSRRRLDHAIEEHRLARQRALRTTVASASIGELGAGLALAGVVVVGVLLGVGGDLTIGEVTAFLLLVTLFVLPAQVATEMLNEMQVAVAGWRRVLDVLDIQPDVADPPDGVELPPGPIEVRLAGVRFAYPATGSDGDGAHPATGPLVLQGIDLDIPAKARVAVVGETGAGKTTVAKLLTRLMDPTDGQVLLSGVPVDRVRFSSLRSRVVMVPQDCFLFDGTIAENVRFGAAGITDEQVATAFAELGLAGWLAGLPEGLETRVGERGESLSVGERQLVAFARAHLAAPDLLVLDEATSAVDPLTEVRLARAMDAVTRDRTTVTIAHRLSTAESADEVIVVDDGQVVQRGPHRVLVADPDSVYGRLHASWLDSTSSDPTSSDGPG